MIEKYRPVVIVVAVLVLVAAVTSLIRSTKSRRGDPRQEWFYVVSTGELTAVPVESVAPLEVEGGRQAVKAVIFTCDTCKPSQWKIAYLETHTPEAREVIVSAATNPSAQDRLIWAVQQGVRVAAPPGGGGEPQWLDPRSPEAQALRHSPATMCNGQPAKLCQP